MEKIKITIEKPKARIPVPKKPPKVEEGKNKYNRRKAKQETEKIIREKAGGKS